MANQKLVLGKGVIQNEQVNQDQREPKRLTDIVSIHNVLQQTVGKNKIIHYNKAKILKNLFDAKTRMESISFFLANTCQ